MILRSSDDVSFKVYRKDLEAYSDGFVGPPSSIDEVEVVQLTETSRVLELLLQFMRRQRQPSFKDVDFNVLDGLAEAAEKYEVFRATEPCKIWMRYILCCQRTPQSKFEQLTRLLPVLRLHRILSKY